MEITVVGRHAEISSRFRAYAEEKVSKVTQYDPRAQRVEIEVSHERNPRLADTSERVELTVISKGPVIRAEASSSDRYAAFDLAIDKLFERLRRARDRKKDHRRYPMITAEVEQALVEQGIEVAPEAEAEEIVLPPTKPGEVVESQIGDSPVILRQKLHQSTPLTIEEALYEMELVGPSFYLFVEASSGQPCVIYHRKGWTYGLLRLETV